MHSRKHSVYVSKKGVYCFNCQRWVKGDLYRCQFCDAETPVANWKGKVVCPRCKMKYDPILAQEGDD